MEKHTSFILDTYAKQNILPRMEIFIVGLLVILLYVGCYGLFDFLKTSRMQKIVDLPGQSFDVTIVFPHTGLISMDHTEFNFMPGLKETQIVPVHIHSHKPWFLYMKVIEGQNMIDKGGLEIQIENITQKLKSGDFQLVAQGHQQQDLQMSLKMPGKKEGMAPQNMKIQLYAAGVI